MSFSGQLIDGGTKYVWTKDGVTFTAYSPKTTIRGSLDKGAFQLNSVGFGEQDVILGENNSIMLGNNTGGFGMSEEEVDSVLSPEEFESLKTLIKKMYAGKLKTIVEARENPPAPEEVPVES